MPLYCELSQVYFDSLHQGRLMNITAIELWPGTRSERLFYFTKYKSLLHQCQLLMLIEKKVEPGENTHTSSLRELVSV